MLIPAPLFISTPSLLFAYLNFPDSSVFTNLGPAHQVLPKAVLDLPDPSCSPV